MILNSRKFDEDIMGLLEDDWDIMLLFGVIDEEWYVWFWIVDDGWKLVKEPEDAFIWLCVVDNEGAEEGIYFCWLE